MNENRAPSNARRRWPFFTLAVILALALTLLVTVMGHASRSSNSRRTWVQIQNLDAKPANYTAYFKYSDGTEAHSESGVILPGCNYYFDPDLPDEFQGGTMRIETDQEIAAVNMYSSSIGSDVFESVFDEITDMLYFAPQVERNHDGHNSRIMVGNLGADVAEVIVTFISQNGTTDAAEPVSISPGGNQTVYPSYLPDQWVGSATISSNQPIFADVMGNKSGQTTVYPAFSPSGGDTTLFAPYVTDYLPGTVTPVIVLQNLSLSSETTVTITPSGDVYTLAKGASEGVPITSGAGPYIITSDQPIAAIVSTESAEGAFAYAALSSEYVSVTQRAPMLFNDYMGWTTTLRVFNTSETETADVTVTYVKSADLADVVTESDQVGPGETVSFTPPMAQSSAYVSASTPIVVLVEGTYSGESTDKLFAYRATPSTLQVQAPTSGQLACEASVGGTMEVFVDSADDSGPSVLLYAALVGVVALGAIVIGSRYARRRLLS